MRSFALVSTCLLVALATEALASISLTPIGSYETEVFASSATEIAAHDPLTQRVFSVNGATGSIEVLDFTNPASPTLLFAIDVTPWGAAANHVDVHDGVLAAAVEASPAQALGRVVFFETSGACAYLHDVEVGALPDMLMFTPDGAKVLVACEGEPNADYSVDPEGMVSIVDLSGGVGAATVANATFGAFDGQVAALRAAGVRIFGPGASVAQDLEPEYVAYDEMTGLAYASCQENNALAVVDVASATVLDILPLGFKNHDLPGHGLDASDRDNAINIRNWPVFGMYQPDGMVGYRANGQFYLVTANEGDARDYSTFAEEARVNSLTLDPTAFPDAATLRQNANLGRLTVTTTLGDVDADGDFDALYVFGGRSFSIWDAAGNLVYDSGDALEQITADLLPIEFNSNNDVNGSFDSRSDNKGPEPEGVAVTEIDGRWYALIGMERIGGVFRFDITDPAAPFFVEYVNTRNFQGDPSLGTAGGLGPEGIRVIPADENPFGQTLVLVSNEVSGSIDVFLLDQRTVGNGPDTRDDGAPSPKLATAMSVYPNPFNPATNVTFSVERAMRVTIDVVDARGRRVALLLDEYVEAGGHSLAWSPTDSPSGVYFARMVAGERVHVQRVTLAK